MQTRYSVLLLVLSLLTGVLHAEIYVDDDAPGDPLPFDRRSSDPSEDGSADHPFDSVQEAIDAAVDGDRIIVAPGRYLSPDPWAYGELHFKGKNIRLVSSAPTDFSVIQKTILCGVIIFQGNENRSCLLQGFKIQNHTCGGILGSRTAASVSHCIISGNGPCGATVVKDVRGCIQNCLIVDNSTFHGCPINSVVSGCICFINCTIANNISGMHLGSAMSSTLTTIQNCIIHGNKGRHIAVPDPVYSPPFSSPWCMVDVRYSLVQHSGNSDEVGFLWATNFDGDPCFVQPGYWVGDVLVEGDYHLKSEGYRWSERPVHGSNWYSDFVTSCAIDAGDPMRALGEEPERGPDDPEGLWGVNHAINVGAYGGTSQASMAPRVSLSPGAFTAYPDEPRPLGLGGVDLRDFLPLAVGNSWSRTVGTETVRSVVVWDRLDYEGYEVYMIHDGTRSLSCLYMDYVLYTIQYPPSEYPQPVFGEPKEAKYTRILTVGSTIEAPADLFAPETSPRRPALVLRGTLAEVLAGTKLDPNELIDSADVIAIREKLADGTAGEPIALFARGVGPLLLDGRPVTEIKIGPVTKRNN